MTYRLAKKRTLQKAGFVHVSGWLPRDAAAEVERRIDEARPAVEDALTEQPGADQG